MAPSSEAWESIAESAWLLTVGLAEAQHGVVSRAQLLELGCPATLVDNWTRSRKLVAAAPRVWRLPGAPITWHQLVQTGLLGLGHEACVSHAAAAQLHGFDRTPPDRLEFTVPRHARTMQLPHGVVHSTRVLPRIDICRIEGLRTTTATRTVIDLARARVPRVRLEAAIDSAIRSGASAPLVLSKRLARLRGPGRWGCRLLDELLLDSGGETLLERRFLGLLREVRLPRPRVQIPFRDGARTVARVDFLYDDLFIIVEVSGGRGHSTAADRAKDAQRRNELQDIGFRVYEFTWEDVEPAHIMGAGADAGAPHQCRLATVTSSGHHQPRMTRGCG